LSFVSGDELVHRTALTHSTVSLTCGDAGTPNRFADWLDGESKVIIAGGHLANGAFGGRLEVNGNTLIIKTVEKNDSGIYTCIKDAGLGNRQHFNLTVEGKYDE